MGHFSKKMDCRVKPGNDEGVSIHLKLHAKKILRFLIPGFRGGLMIAAVLFDEGARSRSDPFSGQSESWPDRGASERPTLVGEGGAPGGAAPCRRARAALQLGPREVGPLIPPQRVPRKHSGASRRSIALAHFPRGTLAHLGRIAPRELKVWLFEI